RVAVGFGAAAVAALALGLLAAMCVPVRLMLEPIIEFVRPIPPLAFLPMFLVWFGLGEASKVAFIGYTTFFPMFVAVAAAVLRVDVTLLRAAASLGAGHLDLIRRVIVPAALPGIIVALRLGFALALFVIVGAEFMGADAGLGHLIMEGLKVNIRWYIAGTDLPSMWGAGNIHLGTATATMVVPIAASGQQIYNVAPQSDIGGVQQVILGKRAQEIVKSPKDFEKLKVGM